MVLWNQKNGKRFQGIGIMAIDREINLIVEARTGEASSRIRHLEDQLKHMHSTARRLGSGGGFLSGMTRSLRFASGWIGRMSWALDSVLFMFRSGVGAAAKFGAAVGLGLTAVLQLGRALIRVASDILGFYARLGGTILTAVSRIAGGVLKIVHRTLGGIVSAAWDTSTKVLKAFQRMGVQAFNTFTSLETEARRAWSNIAGQGEDAFRDVMKGIRSVAWKTGMDMRTVARGLFDPLSSGFESVADAMQIVNAASKLSIAGFAPLEITVKAVISALQAYGLAGSHAADVASKIWVAMAKGRGEMELWAGHLNMVGPIAARAAIGLNDILAFTTLVSKTEGDTARFFTGVRQFVSSLSAPTAKGLKSQAKYAAGAGLDSILALQQGGQGVDLLETVLRISKVIKQFPAPKRLSVLKEMFGQIRGIQSIAGVLGQSESTIRNMFKLMGDGKMSAKELDDAFKGVTMRTAFWIQLLKTRGEVVETFFGQIEATLVSPFFQRFATWVDPLFAQMGKLFDGDWYERLGKRVQSAADAFTALRFRLRDAGGAMRDMTFGQWAMDRLSATLQDLATGIPKWVGTIDKWLTELNKRPGGGGKSPLDVLVENLSNAAENWSNAMKSLAAGFGNVFKGLFANADWDKVLKALIEDWPKALEQLGKGMQTFNLLESWGKISKDVSAWVDLLTGAIKNLAQIFVVFSAVVLPVALSLMTTLIKIGGGLLMAFDPALFAQLFGKDKNDIKGAEKNFLEMIGNMVGAIDGLKAALVSIANMEWLNDSSGKFLEFIKIILGLITVGKGGKGGKPGDVPRFQHGGWVHGRMGTDVVPAMLTAGEFVATRPAADKYGDVLEAMNQGQWNPKDAVRIRVPKVTVPESMQPSNKPLAHDLEAAWWAVDNLKRIGDAAVPDDVDPVWWASKNARWIGRGAGLGAGAYAGHKLNQLFGRIAGTPDAAGYAERAMGAAGRGVNAVRNAPGALRMNAAWNMRHARRAMGGMFLRSIAAPIMNALEMDRMMRERAEGVPDTHRGRDARANVAYVRNRLFGDDETSPTSHDAAGSATAANRAAGGTGITMMQERMKGLRSATQSADAAMMENAKVFFAEIERLRAEKENTRREAESLASVNR